MDIINNYLDMVQRQPAIVYILAALSVILVIVAALWFAGVWRKKSAHQQSTPLPASTRNSQTQPATAALLNAGDVQAWVIRELQGRVVLHPAKISQAYPSLITAGPSLPEAGKESVLVIDRQGQRQPYDEHLVMPFDADSTALKAAMATNWDDLIQFFTAEVSWWKSANLWLTIGLVAGALLLAMVLYG